VVRTYVNTEWWENAVVSERSRKTQRQICLPRSHREDGPTPEAPGSLRAALNVENQEWSSGDGEDTST